MKKIVIETAKILSKKQWAPDLNLINLGPFSKAGIIKPGQFVHIKISDTDILFRRAFSVFDTDAKNDSLSILFKVFGRGTSRLAVLPKGAKVNIMGPLGNGFSFPRRKEMAVLAGGGIGLPPLYLLAKEMIERGYDRKRILIFYGGKTRRELIELNRLRGLGPKVICSTDDGSYGLQGFVSDAIRKLISGKSENYRIYACGPNGMLKAIDEMAREFKIPGQLSLEAPMPCGTGICLGCIVPLRAGGYSRVCREGPVYEIGEVLL